MVRYGAAEKDCTTCIALDESYTKAWMRRAIARTELDRTREAIDGMVHLVYSVLSLAYVKIIRSYYNLNQPTNLLNRR